MNKTIVFIILILGLALPYPALAADKPKPPQSDSQKLYKVLWDKGLEAGKSKKRFYPEVASPHLDNHCLYIGTHGSLFYCLDIATKGQVKWSFQSDGPIASQAVSDSDRVYFGNNEGSFYALNRFNGDLVWRVYVGSEILSQPLIYKGTVYVVTTAREVFAYDKKTGRQKWKSFVKGYDKKFTMRGNSPLLIVNGQILAAFSDGLVARLSSQTGQVVWKKNFTSGRAFFKDIDAEILVDGSYLYIAGYDNKLTKYHLNTSQILWQRDNGSGTHLAHDARFIYLSTLDGSVVVLNKSNGFRVWETELHLGALSPPLLHHQFVLVGSEDGRVVILDQSSGKVLQYLKSSKGYLSQAVSHGKQVYFLSSSGQINALSGS